MISKFNLLAPWSGYGAIDGVLNKNSDAPMVYRVLVPWIIRDVKLWKYEICQVILIYISIVSIYTAWNLSIVSMSMILLTVTFWYDYWDWTLEVIGLSLALVSFPLSILGVMLLGLSRETAPLVGLVYALHTKNFLGGAIISIIGFIVLYIVRKIQGKHPLYCKRWMIKENIELLKKGNISAWLSVLLVAMYLPTVFIRPEAIGLFLLVIAGLTMAKVNETRVFVAVIPYVALFLKGLL